MVFIMNKPLLYRKRIIPHECILLKDDIILSFSPSIIVTKWKALHPKKDLHHGFSCYFLEEGYKISKFCYEDDRLLYWYCDIIDAEYQSASNSYIITDLLADIIIYPDGFVKVVDIGEIVLALNNGQISISMVKKALYRLDVLLKLIYADGFSDLKKYIEQYS